MTQILFIHGGMTFKSQKEYIRFLKQREISLDKKIAWNGDYLTKQLVAKAQIIRPRMPLQDNAKYQEWAIHFERYIPKLKANSILIGESLGGIFLAKYLAENKFPKKLLSVYLVCPPFDNSLPEEDLVGGFVLPSDLSLIQKNCQRLTLLFSNNDPVVPVAHADKFAKKLPKAKIVVYKHIDGHFQVSGFPEIVTMIKSDIKLIKK